jgi:hypothetical protein
LRLSSTGFCADVPHVAGNGAICTSAPKSADAAWMPFSITR